MGSRQIDEALKLMLRLLAIIWVVEGVNLLLGHRLAVFGIIPREPLGLLGILFSPFIHGSLEHALANTVPLAILGALAALNGRKVFLQATAVIILAGGGAVWLLGRSALHVGASGLIFGYFGFLLARAYHQRGLLSLLLAVAAVFLYGGIVWGVLPSRPDISWEGHAFGLAAGVLASAWARG